GLNVLVNNAGIMRAEDLTAATVDTTDAEATVVTNLLGPIRMGAALLPHLRAQARGVIINVTSGLAFVPLALTPTYSATKAALHSYSQALRHQLRDTTVEVIELAPPMVQTELMPGQSTNPMGMPLDAFIAETLSLLQQDPTPAEVLVERVGFLRNAEANGAHAATFAMLNGGH
ncbi:SDR family oxidoreductase, partial [Tabrizicola sp.]|uniref:SDR family oxidoreductase n=1 Tax=Tabrizicola sp. TaxID=2005166 RepID=UPI003F385CAE